MDILASFLHNMLHMKESIIFLHSGKVSPCTARVDKYFKGYCSLEFISHGTLDISFDDDRRILEGPWVWVSSPGPRIRFHAQPGGTPWTHHYATFKGMRAARWQAEGLLPDRPQPLPDPGMLERLFDTFLDLLRRTDCLSTLKAANLLERMLLLIAEQRTGPPHTNHWLVKVVQHLNTSEGGTPDYNALASAMGMGLSTLRRKFRQNMGVSLHQYVLEQRIENAKKLLGDTPSPIKEIAEQLGYQDVYFFSRQFKQQTGIPPGEYRKSRICSNPAIPRS